MKYIPIIAAAYVSHWTLVSADPVFYCVSTADSDLKRYGDFSFYEGCDEGACSCYLSELICLKRSGETTFTLNSESYAYSDSCAATDCICNVDEDRWSSFTAPANGGIALPSPLQIPLPSIEVLKAAYASVNAPAPTVIPAAAEGEVVEGEEVVEEAVIATVPSEET